MKVITIKHFGNTYCISDEFLPLLDSNKKFLTDTDKKEVTLKHIYLEYYQLSKYAWADQMFGQNARKALREYGKILIENGITYIPNLFAEDGKIKIITQW